MLKIAIDFGTSVTKIYKAGSGIVLSEATCIAVNPTTDIIEAYGNEAKTMLGRTGAELEVRFPVYEGEITDTVAAVAILNEFLRKVGVKKKSSVEALFVVPCGIPDKVKEGYFTVCDELGISGFHFVESPCLGLIGADIALKVSSPVCMIDFGGGVTDIGIVSYEGMVAGVCVNIGGNNMDAHIVECIAEKCGLKIGRLTAEKIKNTVGSLVEGDNQTMIVNGSDNKTGKPESIVVSTQSVLYPIRVYLDKIVEYTVMVLRKLPAEVSASVAQRGIYVCGGVAQIPGLCEYLSNKLGMSVKLSEEAQMAVILGAGRTVSSYQAIERLEMKM